MLQTTRSLKISPRGKAPKLLCGTSVLYTSLYFQGGEVFSSYYDETALLKSIVTNKEEPNDSEQGL